MVRYTPGALSCALYLATMNGSQAWTSVNSGIPSMVSNTKQSTIALSAFRSKIVDDPYISLESKIGELIPSNAKSTAGSLPHVSIPSVEVPSVQVPPSIFEPIQNALSKIIETEQALNNMEHTAVSNAARALLGILNSIDEAYAFFVSSVLSIPLQTLEEIVKSSLEAAKTVATSVDDALLSNEMIGPILSTIQNKALALSPIIGEEIASLPPSIGILASAGITYGVISTVLSIGEGPPPSSPYPLGRYDPSSARQYFDQRLGEVIGRGVQIAGLSTKFALGILKDYVDNKMEENADMRAQELALLLTNLGPTFSK